MDFVLIDDDTITLFLAKQLFQLEGVSDQVIAFDDPEEAIKFLQQEMTSGRVPKVILLDLNMPIISGWDFLESLGPYSEQLKSNCLIYLLTSSLDPSELARASEHPQVDDLIQKPLNRSKIRELQENISGNR